MKQNMVLMVCVCILLLALLCFPSEMLLTSSESFSLWFSTVLPSLFPFMTACGILFRLGVAQFLGHFLQPIMKPLFGLSGVCAFPLVTGFLSGYPMGAKTTAMLYENNQISISEAQKILCFCNNPGPLFVIGTVGTGFFGNPKVGYVFLFSIFGGAILAGICCRFFKSTPLAVPYHPHIAKQPFSLILSDCVSDALLTVAQIGGYLVFFSVFTKALTLFGVFDFLAKIFSFCSLSDTFLTGLCSGILEMTNGTYQLSTTVEPFWLKGCFCVGLLCFGGFSILGQTWSVCGKLPISIVKYIFAKILHILFASLLFLLVCPFVFLDIQKAVPVFALHTATAFSPLFAIFSFCLMLITHSAK